MNPKGRTTGNRWGHEEKVFIEKLHHMTRDERAIFLLKVARLMARYSDHPLHRTGRKPNL